MTETMNAASSRGIRRYQRQSPILRAAMQLDDDGGSPGLQVRLTCAPVNLIVIALTDDLSVWALWQDEAWELLLNDIARPEHVGNAWRCGICHDEGRTQWFDSQSALWVDHFFDLLGRWIEDTLLPAAALVFYQDEPGGSTWAELVSTPSAEPDDSVRAVVPLRHGRCQSDRGGA